MDLIVTVLVLALVGFVVWLITTRVPMPPYWALVIQIFAALVLLLWVLRRFGVPSLM